MAKKRKPAAPPTRVELLAACRLLRANLDARRKLLCSIPRRGHSPDPRAAPAMPLTYTLATNSGAHVLRHIAAGQLELITPTLIDALITELSRDP